jgi:tRNA modification GTPase
MGAGGREDTIAALITPPGRAAVALIRLSGDDARSVAEQIFVAQRPGRLRSHHVRYGRLVDPTDGTVIDEVLVTWMRAPHSYTGGDVVEIGCHGGTIAVQRVLTLLYGLGVRAAQPGEFTLRAFLNGRIDLSQAEAVMDVIEAQTTAALAQAQAQLAGRLAQEVRAARAVLLEPLAYLTALIDFPEEGIEAESIVPVLDAAELRINGLLAGAEQGIRLRQGARVVLAGRPNVGKSSLMNALLRSERAIVTPIAGTTRDTLEEQIEVDGVAIVLIDTAGLRASADPIEQIGVARTRAALADADLVLLVLDAQQPLTTEDEDVLAATQQRPTLLVWNKCDTDAALIPALPDAARHAAAVVAIAARSGRGLAELRAAIGRQLLGDVRAGAGERLVSHARQRAALERAAEYLAAARSTLLRGGDSDLIAGDLLVAANALGEISGETVGEDLLDLIFSKFCIGK